LLAEPRHGKVQGALAVPRVCIFDDVVIGEDEGPSPEPDGEGGGAALGDKALDESQQRHSWFVTMRKTVSGLDRSETARAELGGATTATVAAVRWTMN
jgi:hypothetical protein